MAVYLGGDGEAALADSSTPDGSMTPEEFDRALARAASDWQRDASAAYETQDGRGRGDGSPAQQTQQDGSGPLDGLADGQMFMVLVVLIALLIVMDGPGGDRGGVRG